MKAYFTASVVGKRQYLANYVKIIESLKKRGLNVVSDHIIKTTEELLSKETKEERLAFQMQLNKWINESDFVVVDTTFPSISVGYEISLAVQRNKPVLMLYSEGEAPSLLAHFHSEQVVSEKFTPQTLDTIIDDFIKYVEGANDTRFTFFITPEIAHFLENISKKEKLPKSVYLRRLIKEDMEKKE